METTAAETGINFKRFIAGTVGDGVQSSSPCTPLVCDGTRELLAKIQMFALIRRSNAFQRVKRIEST